MDWFKWLGIAATAGLVILAVLFVLVAAKYWALYTNLPM